MSFCLTCRGVNERLVYSKRREDLARLWTTLRWRDNTRTTVPSDPFPWETGQLIVPWHVLHAIVCCKSWLVRVFVNTVSPTPEAKSTLPHWTWCKLGARRLDTTRLLVHLWDEDFILAFS